MSIKLCNALILVTLTHQLGYANDVNYLISRGEQVYYQHCIGCHGPKANNKAFGHGRALIELNETMLKERIEMLKIQKFNERSIEYTMSRKLQLLNEEDCGSLIVYILSLASAK